MSRRALWEQLWKRFDPDRPPYTQWRAERPNSPAGRILRRLDRRYDTPRILLTGTVGTGKTTELMRVAEEREGPELVVFLDLAQHFSEVVRDAAALDRIHAWEVCFLAGLALVGTVKERLGHEFPRKDVEDLGKAWSSLAQATGAPPAQLDIGVLNKAAAELAAWAAPSAIAGPVGQAAAEGLKVLGAAATAIRWVLPLGRSDKLLPDQDTRVQSLLGSVNVLIGEIQSHHRRVLFIIDGLDRIRDITRAKELFVDSQLIAQLACPVVVGGPFALRHHHSAAGVKGFDPVPLVNEPVLLQEDPSRPGPGVQFFCELFERRVEDLGEEARTLISRPLLEELAYRSGGRARDFVHFIRELAGVADDANADAANEALVREALDIRRRVREQGLHKGHIQLLEQVASDPAHSLPDSPLAQELLDYQHLLPYSNGSEWYYPHPLLTMHLVRPKPAGSAP